MPEDGRDRVIYGMIKGTASVRTNVSREIPYNSYLSNFLSNSNHFLDLEFYRSCTLVSIWYSRSCHVHHKIVQIKIFSFSNFSDRKWPVSFLWKKFKMTWVWRGRKSLRTLSTWEWVINRMSHSSFVAKFKSSLYPRTELSSNNLEKI